MTSAYAAEWRPLPESEDGAASANGGGPSSLASPPGDAPPSAAGIGGAVVVEGGMLPLDGTNGTGMVASPDATGAAGAASAERCADGVLGPDGSSCYWVSEADEVWQAARDECVAWQGALVKVESAEEDEFIGSLVSASSWLGASDTVLENVFVWTDGTPIDFGHWGAAQPDRFPGPDCVEKRNTPGRFWYDQPCGNERAFICERAVDAAPPDAP